MCVFEMGTEMNYVRKMFKKNLLNHGAKAAVRFVLDYINLNTFSDFEEQCVIENCQEILKA